MKPTQQVTTPQEATEAAMKDYESLVGCTARPEWVYGYRGDNSEDVFTNGRVLVRIVRTCLGDILHWNDSFLDPYWNVEIVNDPDGLLTNIRSTWIHGDSYEVETLRQRNSG